MFMALEIFKNSRPSDDLKAIYIQTTKGRDDFFGSVDSFECHRVKRPDHDDIIFALRSEAIEMDSLVNGIEEKKCHAIKQNDPETVICKR